MRSLVLIVMIALLPLRMWAAEGMAVRMAHEPLAATAHGPADLPMPDDCPMAAAAAAAGAAGGEPSPQAAGDCMACHLCAGSACLPSLPIHRGIAPTGPPSAQVSGFASAHVAPGLRPPIA